MERAVAPMALSVVIIAGELGVSLAATKLITAVDKKNREATFMTEGTAYVLPVPRLALVATITMDTKTKTTHSISTTTEVEKRPLFTLVFSAWSRLLS